MNMAATFCDTRFCSHRLHHVGGLGLGVELHQLDLVAGHAAGGVDLVGRELLAAVHLLAVTRVGTGDGHGRAHLDRPLGRGATGARSLRLGWSPRTTMTMTSPSCRRHTRRRRRPRGRQRRRRRRPAGSPCGSLHRRCRRLRPRSRWAAGRHSVVAACHLPARRARAASRRRGCVCLRSGVPPAGMSGVGGVPPGGISLIARPPWSNRTLHHLHPPATAHRLGTGGCNPCR